MNINATDSPQSGNTPLHYACSFATEEIVKTLIESGANVNVQNGNKDTPLHDAVARKQEAIVKILLDNGADAGIKNVNNETPLEIAESKFPELVSLFSLSR